MSLAIRFNVRSNLPASVKIINIHYTGFGGLADVVHGLATSQGAEVYEWVMAYYGVQPLCSSHEAFCIEHGFRYATFRPHQGQPWLAWLKLAHWLVLEQPAAIICHSSTTIPPSALAAMICGVPLILVEHKANELKSRSEWAGSYAGMLIADRVVTLTDVYAKHLEARLGPLWRPKKIRLVSNGLDTSVFHPRSEASPVNVPLRAGMAARLTPSKLHDLLIDMADKLDFSLDLAGDGELMISMRAYAERKLSGQISFSGLIAAPEMARWFRGLDIYLHASRGETFSMSVLQAMATGLPIIASDIPGMGEILGDDRSCGLLVSNTSDAWRDAISLLLRSPELRAQMGSAARQRAVHLFSSEVMLKKYLFILEEVMLEHHKCSEFTECER